MSKQTRKSYLVAIKLEAIDYAKYVGNRAAGRMFAVTHTQIAQWRKKEEELKKANMRSRRVGSGKEAAYPLAEDALKEWIVDLRNRGIGVTSSIIKSKMTEFLSYSFSEQYPNAAQDFKASDSWFNLFLRRHNFSLRRRTKIGQKLPQEIQQKVANFHEFIKNIRLQNNFDPTRIINLDETPVFFDMVGALTIDYKGVKTVHIRTTGNDKNRFTCVLAVLGDGTKLPPMVIFKGKRLQKGDYPPDVIVRMNKNDSFRGHLTQTVKSKCQEKNLVLGVIPGGLTSIVQPLDVSINKPFKNRLREKWRTWMAEGKFEMTRGGNLKRPDNSLMCHWISEAWSDIPYEIIVQSFKTCGISNDLNGTEDNLIWKENSENAGERDEPVIVLPEDVCEDEE
ncbi:10171_t:CDS:2 [Paraglomus occultum]|uniref:10171_t:CDS:1 n=1 Tax=Paraglomus occultum TaxID=144539 RepID=A0A9N9H2S3_9GLOM|nr:10171_t:CDS:2 [Paraglomus occultum]